MIPVPSGVRVWLAVGRTDMRRLWIPCARFTAGTADHDKGGRQRR
jgi:hypothetical protein